MDENACISEIFQPPAEQTKEEAPPTPRPNRIEHDYSRDYAEAEARKTSASARASEKKGTIDKVKLNEEVSVTHLSGLIWSSRLPYLITKGAVSFIYNITIKGVHLLKWVHYWDQIWCVCVLPWQQEVDSDDEWKALVDTTDPESSPVDSVLQLIEDKQFVGRVRSRMQSASVQVVEATLEGAARLRPVLRVITNLLSFGWWVTTD